MSRGSDWVNLFVNQSKEFIDSVSSLKKKGEIAPESKTAIGSVNNSGKLAELGLGKLEGMDNDSRTKNGEGSSAVLAIEAGSLGAEEMQLTKAEKEVYENQLEQLQEQLVDIMIKNQEMGMGFHKSYPCITLLAQPGVGSMIKS